MDKGNEKVIDFENYRKDEAPRRTAEAPCEAKKSSQASLPLFLSIFSIVLALALFVSLNRGQRELSDEIRSPGGIREEVQKLGSKYGAMEVKISELEKLPQKTKMLLLNSMIQEMAQKAQYLSDQVDDPDQAAKLHRAIELLKDAQAAQ